MPIDPELFQRGIADARAGIPRDADTLDHAPPDYAAGYIAATPLEGLAAVDVEAAKPSVLVEHLYEVASRLDVPIPVAYVTRATVALLGASAEARARRHARALFDRDLQDDDEEGVDQASAA